VPLVGGCAVVQVERRLGSGARFDSSEQAPDPARTPEPVVQIYAARTVGWRGLFGVHTWIVMKHRDATKYTRYEVVGRGVIYGLSAVRVDLSGPDANWFGVRPYLLLDLRGEPVQRIIDRIEAAIARYPYTATYRTWPGPNSNTFMAWIAREVPELALDLPPTAIGKDFLPNGAFIARTPGGVGVQVSVWGILGVLAGWEEGFEIDLFGMTFGLDLKEPALKVPAVGRVGHPGTRHSLPR
jgi:hypothetical protein